MLIYTCSRNKATLAFITSHVSCDIALSFWLSWSPPTPERNIWLFSAGQIAYGKKLPVQLKIMFMRVVTVNQDSEVTGDDDGDSSAWVHHSVTPFTFGYM